MKRTYEIPEMKLICMEAEDVITTSGITGKSDNFGDGDNIQNVDAESSSWE